ncbi:MAG: carboxylesterase family protein [Geminicoccaceae bacterium]
MSRPGLVAALVAACLALAAWLGPSTTPAEATVCAGTVSSPAGTLCGLALPAPAGTSRALYGYRGIRYAQPPTGALRWAAPQPAAAWTGTLQATSFGAVCPQQGATTPVAEDCLFLNVWTPQAAVARKQSLPVMVFIHGGAFTVGAGSMPYYDGSYLAASGNVVVVTLNYRLGALGFLASSELGLTGNFGILDQRLALGWVAKNIASFGGDPAKVTIFGESAGAMSVGLHLFSIPQDAGLFRAAIMESNPLGVPYPSLPGQIEAKWQSFRADLCAASGQPATCSFDLAGLQALPLAQIEAADASYSSFAGILERILVSTPIANLLPWTPIVDGQIFTGPTLIQSQPYLGFYSGAAGTAPAKPYMIGVNRDEGALFAYLINAAAGGMTSLEYNALLTGVFGPGNALRIAAYANRAGLPYSPADQAPLPPWFANSAAAAATSKVFNDFAFRCGSFLAADRVVSAPSAPPVFAYVFAQAPIFSSPRVPACNPLPSQPGFQNACHEFELPYVFNSFAATDATTVPPANAALSKRMARNWTDFATVLDPGLGWGRYRATLLPGGNRIKILSTGSAATGALTASSPMTAANCTALWAKLPPFAGSFPTAPP